MTSYSVATSCWIVWTQPGCMYTKWTVPNKFVDYPTSYFLAPNVSTMQTKCKRVTIINSTAAKNRAPKRQSTPPPLWMNKNAIFKIESYCSLSYTKQIFHITSACPATSPTTTIHKLFYTCTAHSATCIMPSAQMKCNRICRALVEHVWGPHLS